MLLSLRWMRSSVVQARGGRDGQVSIGQAQRQSCPTWRGHCRGEQRRTFLLRVEDEVLGDARHDKRAGGGESGSEGGNDSDRARPPPGPHILLLLNVVQIARNRQEHTPGPPSSSRLALAVVSVALDAFVDTMAHAVIAASQTPSGLPLLLASRATRLHLPTRPQAAGG